MTIDKKGIDEIIRNIEGIFNSAFESIPEGTLGRKWLKDTLKSLLIEQTLKDLKELAENRPPTFFLIGRTQTGKSSLINAIVGKQVADVGDNIKSLTTEAKKYSINFPEINSTLVFVDSRGYFESKKLKEIDAVTQLKQDITKHKPDVILHILNSEEVASAEKELNAFKNIQDNLKQQTGEKIPTIIVINKIDKIGKTRKDILKWPPEEYLEKANDIEKVLNTVAENLKIKDKEPIDSDKKYKGYEILNDETYCGIIPTCSDFDEPWNIETLKDFIATQLPKNSLLQGSQALKTTKGLKKISTGYINTFSAITGGIGAIPHLVVGGNTVKHIFVITPLQILLIMIIAGLSGRKISRDTAVEFLGAVGANVGAATIFQAAFNELVTLVPGWGQAWGAGVAASGTWMIGKAAEYYFFDNEKVTKEVLEKSWEEAKEKITDLMKDWAKKLGQ